MRAIKCIAIAAAMIASAAFVSASADAQSVKPKMTICTGGSAGNYYKAGFAIAEQVKDMVDVTVAETKGSMANLRLMDDGKCDLAIVQNDALKVYKSQFPASTMKIERADSAYLEYVHFICNRQTGVDRITKLTDKHVIAIGSSGTGTSVNWDGFVLADKDRYGKVQTVPLDNARALAKVADGTEVQCMIYTAGLNSSFMKDVNQRGDRVVLRAADDGDFDSAKDERGKPIYEYVSIPSGTYNKIQDGTFGSAVKTVGVQAIFIARANWIDENERTYNMVLTGINRAMPKIKALVAPK